MTAALDRARREFASQPFMQTVGAEITLIGDGAITVEFDISEKLTQQHGYVHAGALASVLDTACGFAALTTLPTERTVLTAEFKVNLLRPATGDRVVVNANVLKSGRTLIVCEGSAHTVRGEDAGAMCAVMTATLASVAVPQT